MTYLTNIAVVPTVSHAVEATRERMVEFGRLMFDRRLTDASGGNLGVRLDDVILMTSRYAGSKWQWHLRPEQVLLFDLAGNKLDGEGDPSREFKVHHKLLTEFSPTGTAVVHAHPRNVLVFCTTEKPMPPVLDCTQKFGEIPCLPFTPAHSAQLAEQIAAAMRGQEGRIAKQAAAVMAARHGMFILANSLDAGYDALERLDNNAYCVLFSKLLTG
jgi:L-fuculose-phosphate aldolase